ncbi:hypothetical protein EHS25_008810 [Saitozyma podzolica]|uniref:Nuclear fusion protein KAR5 n=1 Tax=Saitozyma podzolica TaxID=1890683 RepID=A0A427YMT3_9TREE|nr:hypothetical protein EHS25_008810 [Saitozyma podzolica]
MRLRSFFVLGLVLGYVSASSPSVARRGGGGERVPGELEQLRKDIADLDLATSELQVFGDPDAYRSVERSGCHSKIAERLREGCAKSLVRSVSGMEEAESRGIAISLTLCSMLSALQPIPDECRPWSDSSHEARPKGLAGWALHRSPQDWSSYNGYLSDATQLCFALQGRRQAELAQQIYVNATREKIELLRVLKQEASNRRAQDVRMREDFFGGLRNMEAHAQLARENTDTLCTQIQRQESSVGDLKAALKSFESDRAVVWEIVQQEAIQQTRQTIAQLEREFAALKELMMFETALSLRGALDEHVEQHGLSLAGVLGNIQRQADDIAVRTADHMVSFDGLSTRIIKSADAMHQLSGGLQALVPLVETSTTRAQSLLSTEVSIRETSAHSHMVSERLANALTAVNDSLASITLWRNEIGSRSPWRLSLFSAPSLFSFPPAATSRGLQTVLQGVDFSLGIMLQVVLQGMSGLVWIAVSLWIAVRTGLSRTIGRLSSRIWEEFGVPADRDEEKAMGVALQ